MNSRGMTLVEVLVTLVLLAVIAATGGAAFGGSVEGLRAVEQVGRTRRSELFWRTWLERTIRSLEVGLPGDVPFDGAEAAVGFSARVLTPDGWWERKSVRLELAEGTLIARSDSGEPLALVSGLSGARFDYLIQPGLQSRWGRVWRSPTSAPEAIRVRLFWQDSLRAPDTLLLTIGRRG
jgi:prepilin-type N-terminal cleavage/methylation domain-containing protein